MALAPHSSESQWPPRSPREALLSTPAGRQRYKQAFQRTSPPLSPSPSRRTAGGIVDDELGEGDDDEDEETLQLKLQEIQARLRLKKLQNAKNKDSGSLQSSVNGWALPPPGTRASEPSQVQVPASPVRNVQAHQQQTSPSRVLLGIDKGLKAKDISLKRAPSQRSTRGSASSHPREFLTRSRSTNLPSTSSFSSAPSEALKSQSFNERLTLSRTEEAIRAQRQERIQQVRTNAFGIGKQEMEQFKRTAIEIPDEPLKKPPTFSRDEILSQDNSTLGHLTRSKTTPAFRSQPRAGSGESYSLAQSASQVAAPTAVEDGEKESPSFEPYSCFHLARRILPHRVLARHVSGMKSLSIKELLRDVKSPDYSLPDVEQDIVVFAIVAKKSEPRAHKPSAAKNGSQGEERGKYMVMTLVDLDYELDLFLFNSGFTAFWKLTEGTVVAILNPGVMPPPPGRQDTGRFSLVINSDADTILEIGSARDMGFCQSVKKDGAPCGSWVNKKRTQFCEFHSNEAVRKQRSKRLEVNSSGFGGWDGRKKGSKKKGWAKNKDWEDWKKDGPDNYDRETGTQWFASRTYSAAELIDGKDRGPADKKEKSEFLKRSLEAKEKEREMMKKLGRVGNAAGKEYMQRAGQKTSGKSPHNSLGTDASDQASGAGGEPDETGKANAISLGLQRGKDRRIHLSPIKRKRAESSQAGSTAGSAKSSGFGWGSSLKDKLSRMKEGEELRPGGRSPVRKKTRFVTDKGIREAGRESLGVELPGGRVSVEDDDDDELIIVK
ncbi:primase zinc finger domain-containing protein [Hirsutella rhossiliensis]|uniref:Primase zinc finger domain-containing protein n=1 Tax=Hirsutella rhossiliensis TaxID=111463 RepID=A0A9P8MPD0_9HYPO|nr:primase zinc finger domain-containing protein [Hirsutella rhossiliensis]KAH0958689.1 primase zinc finger domain-containing protein [Hirsutella rhossiliensis]